MIPCLSPIARQVSWSKRTTKRTDGWASTENGRQDMILHMSICGHSCGRIAASFAPTATAYIIRPPSSAISGAVCDTNRRERREREREMKNEVQLTPAAAEKVESSTEVALVESKNSALVVVVFLSV